MHKVPTSDRLKTLMSERNLKQIDIINLAKPYCKKYGVKLGRNDLSQYVSGKCEPRQNKLYVLSEALKVNPVWLMGYDVSIEPTTEITHPSTYENPKSFYSIEQPYILDKYNKLNTLGQQKTDEYIDDLLKVPEYTLPDDINIAAENQYSAHADDNLDDIEHT